MNPRSPGSKILFGVVAFAVIGGGALWLTVVNNQPLPQWVSFGYLGVIIAAQLTGGVVETVYRRRRGIPLFGPDDVDRRGRK